MTPPKKSRLYYEAHVTVEGITPMVSTDFEKAWAEFSLVADALGWRASRFDVDEVDHYDGAWFLSYRHELTDDIKQAVKRMVTVLTDRGYKVIRWKIEDTLFDSKHGNQLDQLVCDHVWGEPYEPVGGHGLSPERKRCTKCEETTYA